MQPKPPPISDLILVNPNFHHFHRSSSPMEERVPSAPNRTVNLPPPSPPQFDPYSFIESPSPPPYDHNRIISPLPPPPGSETFVIQIPRDQVYRVPPPENSKIVENYINESKVKKGPSPCFWILIAIVTIGVFLGIFFGVIKAVYKPKIPEFKLKSFIVNHPPPSDRKDYGKPSYEISFNVKNPNERMDISYRNDEYGLLTFKNKKIGDGKFEPFSQEARKSSNLKITLKGAKVAMPTEVENSLKSTKSEKPVSLRFKMFVSAKISSWAKTSRKDIAVRCDFKVNTLAKGTKIVADECSTEVQ